MKKLTVGDVIERLKPYRSEELVVLVDRDGREIPVVAVFQVSKGALLIGLDDREKGLL